MNKLKKGEQHPTAAWAVSYIMSLGKRTHDNYLDILQQPVMEKHRLSGMYADTLTAVTTGQPATDLDILALAFALKSFETDTLENDAADIDAVCTTIRKMIKDGKLSHADRRAILKTMYE